MEKAQNINWSSLIKCGSKTRTSAWPRAVAIERKTEQHNQDNGGNMIAIVTEITVVITITAIVLVTVSPLYSLRNFITCAAVPQTN